MTHLSLVQTLSGPPTPFRLTRLPSSQAISECQPFRTFMLFDPVDREHTAQASPVHLLILFDFWRYWLFLNDHLTSTQTVLSFPRNFSDVPEISHHFQFIVANHAPSSTLLPWPIVDVSPLASIDLLIPHSGSWYLRFQMRIPAFHTQWSPLPARYQLPWAYSCVRRLDSQRN